MSPCCADSGESEHGNAQIVLDYLQSFVAEGHLFRRAQSESSDPKQPAELLQSFLGLVEDMQQWVVNTGQAGPGFRSSGLADATAVSGGVHRAEKRRKQASQPLDLSGSGLPNGESDDGPLWQAPLPMEASTSCMPCSLNTFPLGASPSTLFTSEHEDNIDAFFNGIISIEACDSPPLALSGTDLIEGEAQDGSQQQLSTPNASNHAMTPPHPWDRWVALPQKAPYNQLPPFASHPICLSAFDFHGSRYLHVRHLDTKTDNIRRH